MTGEDLATVLADAAVAAAAGPAALAEIDAARAHVQDLIAAYAAGAEDMGRRLRDAGGDLVTGGSPGLSGWCGRTYENLVMGFTVDADRCRFPGGAVMVVALVADVVAATGRTRGSPKCRRGSVLGGPPTTTSALDSPKCCPKEHAVIPQTWAAAALGGV